MQSFLLDKSWVLGISTVLASFRRFGTLFESSIHTCITVARFPHVDIHVSITVVVYYRATWCTFQPQPLKYFHKSISYIFFPKRACSEKASYISQKCFSDFQETELSYVFFKKIFAIFWERYIQNPVIFRILPNTMIERFAKIATWCTFQPKLKK